MPLPAYSTWKQNSCSRRPPAWCLRNKDSLIILTLVELPAGVGSELMGLEEDFHDSGVLRATMDIPNARTGGYQGHNSLLPGTALHVAPLLDRREPSSHFQKHRAQRSLIILSSLDRCIISSRDLLLPANPCKLLPLGLQLMLLQL